ncbi:MAG: OmpA family protein [Cyanophyceae cyanobacterium]
MKQRDVILSALAILTAGCHNQSLNPVESPPAGNPTVKRDKGSLSAQVSNPGQAELSANVRSDKPVAPSASVAGEARSLSAQVGASTAEIRDRSAQTSMTNRESSLRNAGSSLTASVSDLSSLISDLGGRTTETEIIVDLPSDVLFDFDRADIRPDAVPTLEKLVRLLNASDSQTVQINGHTDSEGSDDYNRQLSQRRAESVAAWLVAAGIEESIVQTAGYGETQPIAENKLADGSDNPQGRAKNRRVEVIVPKK